jgi:hypothetical protein
VVLARRSRAAAVTAGLHVILTVRALRRVDLPVPAAAELALRGVIDAAVATGRAATMLVPGVLAVGLSRRRCAPAALALLLAEPARSWMRSGRGLDPLRWSALAVADDVAYGAGVWAVRAAHADHRAAAPALSLRGFPARRSRPDGVGTPGPQAG